MTKIQPINNHLLIQPLEAQSFLSSSVEQYEQVGVVLALPTVSTRLMEGREESSLVEVGDRVYFDAWLAGKYPNPEGGEGAFYWLVNYDDLKAIEKNEKNEVSA
ncbi:MAG: hypothetical protein KGI72_05290 [Patescibacteria group bacterium]|nr:hypothetical protein [Patescibacteria group bacterium]MDE2233074.1 hypothetical protein [Patescibacteria group bacterium]